MNCRRLVCVLSGLSLVVVFVLSAGAVQTESAELVKQEKLDARAPRFFVYEDVDSESNHGYWANWMGPDKPEQAISLAMDDGTKPAFGKSCVRMTIKFITPPNWAALAVSSQPGTDKEPGYWGKEDGEGYELGKASKLVVHVRGERGGECIQIKCAIAGDKPFGDSAKIPVASRWVKLTREWQRLEIPIDQERTPLTRTITPLVIVSDRAHNVDNEITFYMDHCYFVLAK